MPITARACVLFGLFLTLSGGAQEGSNALCLSPEAAEVAEITGVRTDIDRFFSLPPSERGAGGAVMSIEALTLRQRINDRITSGTLDALAAVAEIDNERAQIDETRHFLEADREKDLRIASLASLIAGAGVGVLGSALSLGSEHSNAGDIVSLVSGAASAALSVVALRLQHGDVTTLHAPNMLAPIFGQAVEPHTRYPDVVWRYLNTAPPGRSINATWIQQLVAEWRKWDRIPSGNGPKVERKIKLLTGAVSARRRLDIESLSDRYAMLGDVRARVLLMTRDLADLMRAVVRQQ